MFLCLYGQQDCVPLPRHPSIPTSLAHYSCHQGEEETGEQEQLWSSVNEGVSH